VTVQQFKHWLDSPLPHPSPCHPHSHTSINWV